MAALPTAHRFLLEIDSELSRSPSDNNGLIASTNVSATNRSLATSRARTANNVIVAAKKIIALKQFFVAKNKIGTLNALSLDQPKEAGKKFVRVLLASKGVDVPTRPGQLPDYLEDRGLVYVLYGMDLAILPKDLVDNCPQMVAAPKPKKKIAGWTTAQTQALIYYIEKRIREVKAGPTGNDRRKFASITDQINACSEIVDGRTVKFPQRTWVAIDTKIKKDGTVKTRCNALLKTTLADMGRSDYTAKDMPAKRVWGGVTTDGNAAEGEAVAIEQDYDEEEYEDGEEEYDDGEEEELRIGDDEAGSFGPVAQRA
ncbi:uncharacterized protein PAC_18593 [Phialocephala subalpina]|uniref:Uncharacterized protein n=1 Tax=Phialocephala subalpina TaxID=576137 RepID=A0A1L7XUI6_9HELO|nr:uncharacterized protein PAC_18593 [Phialocephala subalpina]